MQGGLLALLMVLAGASQALAWYPNFCLKAEKYVSTNGLNGPFVRNSETRVNPDPASTYFLLTSVPGTGNVPAPTVNIPTDFYGDSTKVVYKFVITNCGIYNLYNLGLDDCIDTRSAGAAGFLLGGGRLCTSDTALITPMKPIAQLLKPGESVTLTSASFPLDVISTVDVCGKFGKTRTNGIVRNNVLVKADAELDGNGVLKTIFFEDLNLVQCKDFTPAPAALGDRVWRDTNGNGIQNCQDANNNGIIGDVGDTGTECNAGIPGVAVNLVDCLNPATVLASTTTNARGFYLFQQLTPGQYCVEFQRSTIPAATCASGVPQFTNPNVGSNDAIDSDVNPTTGLASAVTLISGQTNRTVDAGVVCKGCSLAIDKKCSIAPPSSPNYVCAKPIDSVTMIWTGQSGIYVKAWKGTPGTTLLATVGPIATGEKVTVTGMGGSSNDQTWEIFSALPDPAGANRIGQSIFHISCSDVDMNGPEDCGKLEGNAKTTTTALINLWRFDGMSGGGQTLACTPASTTGQDDCSFVAGAAPSCKTLGAKPKTLTFRYTGSACSASLNSQASDKWSCSGTPGTSPIVSIVKDPARIRVTPTTPLGAGDLVTVSALASDMGSEIQLMVGGQALKVHTSCSQPLAVGDAFGSLQLVQFNGQGAGAAVNYSYLLKNNGSSAVDITSVADDKLGQLLTQPAHLQAGAAVTLTKSAFITQTTTNKVTATARFAGTSTVCGQASDEVTVTVTQPTCSVAMAFENLGDASVKFKVTNSSSIVATLDTFQLSFPAGYGAIREIRLDGTIFKSSSTVPPVASGARINATGWTNPDLGKRQLDPGETRVLEVIFTKKAAASGWTGIANPGGVTFKEGCQATFPAFGTSQALCRAGKPVALVFQYTGQPCSASRNTQAAGKWTCSGDPAMAQPVSVTMTKDASVMAVSLKNDVDGDGRIDVGDSFEISRTDGREFSTETAFNIVSGSTTLQSLMIHTSCSQPLNFGDQFGSARLVGFTPKP